MLLLPETAEMDGHDTQKHWLSSLACSRTCAERNSAISGYGGVKSKAKPAVL
jgi:hypothetical protein